MVHDSAPEKMQPIEAAEVSLSVEPKCGRQADASHWPMKDVCPSI
jgi:hypothetical protein